MSTAQLKEYIEECRASKISDAEIENKLLEAGWKKEDIDQAFKEDGLEQPTAANPSPISPPSQPVQAQEKPESVVIPAEEKTSFFQKIPKIPSFFRNVKILLVLFVLLFLVALGFGGLQVYRALTSKTEALVFLPDDTEFYLSLSVRKHPQVQKARALVEKLPGKDRLLKQFDQFSRELLGGPKDPFKDIFRLAEQEIFLAKVSKTERPDPKTGLPRGGGRGGLEKLINFVSFKSSKEAQKNLKTFEE